MRDYLRSEIMENGLRQELLNEAMQIIDQIENSQKDDEKESADEPKKN